MRQAPLRQRVGGEALVEHGHRGLHALVAQVGEELHQVRRHHHALVDDGGGRQAGQVERGVRVLARLLGAATRHEQLAVERGLVHVGRRIHEHLRDGGQRLQRLVAAGTRDRSAARASRRRSAPRARSALRVRRGWPPPIAASRLRNTMPAANSGASLMPASFATARRNLSGFFSSRPQPSPVLPSAAIAPRCVRRFSEAMAVFTSQ